MVCFTFQVNHESTPLISPGFTKKSDGFYYKHVHTDLNFDDAARNCQPGRLAIIHSQLTNDIITRMLGSGFAWIGLKNKRSSRDIWWHWVDKSVITYHNWQNTKPINDEGDCGEIFGATDPGEWRTRWDDEECYIRQPSVCQWNPGE